MNRRSVARCTLLVLVLALSSRPVYADPIPITAGHLEMGRSSGSLLLIGGERDFSLSASVGVFDAFFGPWLSCTPACAPGATINVGANFTGFSLRNATGTIDGETFFGVGGLVSGSSASVRFMGSTVAPPLDGDTATVIAPFLLEGSFLFSQSIGAPVTTGSFFGLGTATVTLQRDLPTVWSYAAADYEFDPIPEPATLLLTASGLMGVIGTRLQRGRRRAAAHQPNSSA